ncbi:hypothetical protein HanXRQr2_Chr02g0076401 [Helianthus annuus]|uniref:Uncharacterized protein n=1 Tax=Helianthus annuus TaxID=4232 RepID=A0A9K3JPG7_HELAN|nr:hypothetical protein HanXRQr2_Chr02g0076401 [Helianthus annuus]
MGRTKKTGTDIWKIRDISFKYQYRYFALISRLGTDINYIE